MRRVSWAISKAGITAVSSTKMEPFPHFWRIFTLFWNGEFQKKVKIPQNKTCTISEKGQNSSTKMVKNGQNSSKKVPFQKRVEIVDKNDTISEKGQNSSTKNGTISEKGQNSSTKIVPFQKSVKIH